MPWCPKCKMEYREGMTVCADCGTELVDELTEDLQDTKVELVRLDTEEHAKKLIDFLEYSQVFNASYEYDEKDISFIIYVEADDLKEAKKLFRAFYIAETENTAPIDMYDTEGDTTGSENDVDDAFTDITEDENDHSSDSTEDHEVSDIDTEYDTTKEVFNPITGTTTTPSKKTATSVYVKKEDKYRDMKSTGFIFIGIGIVVLTIILLNVFGIFSFYTNAFAWVVMGTLAVVLILIGIGTLARTGKVKGQIAEEEALTNAINAWLEKTMTEEALKSIDVEGEVSEINYFKRIEYMKNAILDTFDKDLDDSYVDYIVDEFYNSHFEE